MIASIPRRSRVRTFLFGALAVVWFGEMVLWGFSSLSTMWARLWQIPVPADPQLATALSAILSLESPVKGALYVLAVFGLRSRNPATRTALFASMALVPPLNIAFPFRQQGFLPGPMMVATILSVILWGSFFLFREESAAPQARPTTAISGPSRWETAQRAWFAANSAALTLLALLFLLRPTTGLDLVLPCLRGLPATDSEGMSSLIHKAMGTGTHLAALTTASWIATVRWRNDPALRRAVTFASTTLAGLFLFFPVRRIALEYGGACATSSLLIAFAPLFVAWLLYAAGSLPRKAADVVA